MTKLLTIDIENAFSRAVSGESVRKIAASLHVTEGALRYRFGKIKGASPKEVRQVAYRLLEVSKRRAMLSEPEQRLVDVLVAIETK